MVVRGFRQRCPPIAAKVRSTAVLLTLVSPKIRGQEAARLSKGTVRGMARNVGPEDRVVRIVVALALAVVIYVAHLTGVGAIIAGVVAAYLLITGPVWCAACSISLSALTRVSRSSPTRRPTSAQASERRGAGRACAGVAKSPCRLESVEFDPGQVRLTSRPSGALQKTLKSASSRPLTPYS